MSVAEIIELITLAITLVGLVGTIIVSIRNGEMKNFVIEKMEEAEEKFKDLEKPEKSIKKLDYVINAVKEKYKVLSIIINVKEIIERLVKFKNKK